MPTALPHHRVPPGLLMVMRRHEVEALANWNDRRDDDLAMAVEQWRFNVATREAILDAGGAPIPGGGHGFIGARTSEADAAWSWHFPQERRQCPDGGTCHHSCGPVAGCWRVAHCLPLSRYGEDWTLGDRITHEHHGGTW